jgi:membrane protein
LSETGRKKVLNVFDEFSEIRFSAASLAFSTLLSLIPFLIIILAVLQSIGGLEKFYPQIESVMISYLKEATGTTVSQYIKTALSQFNPRDLGITGGFFLLLTSLSLIRAMDIAFQRIWKIKVIAPIHHRIWLYWVILVLAPVTMALYAGLKSFNYFDAFSQTIEQQFLLSLGTAAFIFLVYKIIPQTRVNFRCAFIPAILAASALAGIQKSFLWVSLKIFKQNKIYGSLISFPIFLLWLLVVWYVVLSGVALSAYMQGRAIRKAHEIED